MSIIILMSNTIVFIYDIINTLIIYSGSKNYPNILVISAICLIPFEVNYGIFQKYSSEH